LKHIDVVDAGGGVQAAIAKADRGAVGNAAAIDLAGETLIVDTHYSPSAARELRAAAGAPAFVLNTHWHADHVLGNSEFADTTIVSTTRTRELIATLGAERLAAQMEAWDEELPAEIERLRAAGDEEGAALLEEQGPELRSLTHRLPDETFDGSHDFGRAQALTYGGGHTESDAFVLVPDAGVLVAGDLVVVEMQPWAGHGNPREWAGILDRLLELDWDTCVPGHGPVCGRDVLPPLRDYLRALDEGGELPDRFRDWGQPEMWERNLEALSG
jgi:cyclase